VFIQINNLVGIKPLIFKGCIFINTDFPTLLDVQNGWTYEIKANVIDNNSAKTNTGKSFLKNDEIAWDGTTWVTLGADPKEIISVSNETEFLQAVDYLNTNDGGIIELINSFSFGQAIIDYQQLHSGIDLSKVIIKSSPTKIQSLNFNGIVLKVKGRELRIDDTSLNGTLTNVFQNTQTLIEVAEHLSRIEFNNVGFNGCIGQNSDVTPVMKINHNDSTAYGTEILFSDCSIYTIGCSSNEHDSFSIQNLCPQMYSLIVKVIGQSKTRLNHRVSYKVYGNKVQQVGQYEETRRLFVTDTSADLIQVENSELQLLYSPIILTNFHESMVRNKIENLEYYPDGSVKIKKEIIAPGKYFESRFEYTDGLVSMIEEKDDISGDWKRTVFNWSDNPPDTQIIITEWTIN
jgi:hypothetical protein